jgi:CheY-like chemotaxis protein/DNA-directed RNA polymerase specialized sigma24 family protein
MPDTSQEIVKNLPYLRRYARALTGSQANGDGLVRVCLETLLQEPDRLTARDNVRRQLFRLFHEVWQRLAAADSEPAPGVPGGKPLTVEARLRSLPSQERQILLLTALEGFPNQDAAAIIGVDEGEAPDLLARAWQIVNDQVATNVLIIEDEPVIALDLVGLVREMGHSVVGVASSRQEAVAMARARRPGLVLADINLGEGGSGLAAVKEILEIVELPVIFVTAFPERLLTGERPEPTYLVTKPFQQETLKVTISQALAAHAHEAPTERRA